MKWIGHSRKENYILEQVILILEEDRKAFERQPKTVFLEEYECTVFTTQFAHIFKVCSYENIGSMMMPDRIYTDTTQTEEIIFSVVSYEKLNTEQNFKFGTEGWEGSSGMDTSTVNTKVEASSTATNAALDHYYTTQANQKYKPVLSLEYGSVDSIDLKIHNQGPQSLLISEDLITQGKLVYEFTAATNQVRVRLKRKDAGGPGNLSFYLDRALLYAVRDTLQQDTVRLAKGDGYRYGFNGMERDDEWNGVGNSYDFGARIYDARLGRWLAIEPRAREYPASIPYRFALNAPIGAIDPDGEVVVFMNGNHFGDGGKAAYWRQYRDVLVIDRKATQWGDPGEHHYEKQEVYAFDKQVMEQFNDYKAVYKDGAIGGYAPLNGLDASDRHTAGFDAAMNDAKPLLDNLDDGETIKIVSHSMGGAYAKGYVQVLQQYMKDNSINAEIEVDFAPYQPDSEQNNAVSGVPTYQASHSNDGVAGNDKMKGATQVNTSSDSEQGHSIFNFKGNCKKTWRSFEKRKNRTINELFILHSHF